MADKWDGKGTATSLNEIVAYMERHGATRDDIQDVRDYHAEVLARPGSDTASAARWAGGRARELTEATERRVKRAQVKANPPKTAQEAAATGEYNNDGKTDQKDEDLNKKVTEAGGTPLDQLIEGLGQPGDSSKGAPLWDTTVTGDTLNGVQVINRSFEKGKGKPKAGDMIGARYYDKHLLAPLKWSEEKRAALQKDMYAIGLYGTSPVRLGSWGKGDEAALLMLLQSANSEGRTYRDQINFWRTSPPADIIAALAANKPKVQLSNPLDIQAVAAQTSQDLTGGGTNADFITNSVGGYQNEELAAGQAMQGGGDTVTQAPSAGAYLADKLRREKPKEVGGYGFVKAFDVFANMMNGVR